MNSLNAPVLTQDQSVDALLKTIKIPARPSLLAEVQTELAKNEPDPQVLGKIISNDVSMSASLLKLANSPFFGLRMKARSVDHAVNLVGMTQCGTLMIGIVARQAIAIEGVDLTKFWDFSTKRAQAMSYLVKHIRVCSNDAAHTFGLFCDIGIPLLTERFPNYPETIAKANICTEGKFTDVEDQVHSTNHTAIGALMARTWGLPDEITTAILLHHDYKTLNDPSTDDTIRGLIALALLAEFAIQKYHGLDLSVEWEKGGKAACNFLGISEHDASDRFEELYELFNQGQ